MREKQEDEKAIVLEKQENFEKGKEKVRKKKTLDVFELKHRIETGRSLSSLKGDIENALHEGTISFEIYQKTLRSIEGGEKEETGEISHEIDLTKIPFSGNALAQYLENKKIGENPLVDILGVMYGFFVQGSALMVILIWNMLLDLLKLPRDIYTELTEAR